MKPVSIKDLEAITARINRVFGAPAEPYTRGADGRFRANVGNFHLSQAYGGACLHRTMNEDGGVVDVLTCGHIPRRALQSAMLAYLAGVYDAGRA